MTLNWHTGLLNKLTPQQIIDIYRVRAQVFVVEQNCPYQDPDDQDLLAYHMLGYDAKSGQIAAYARILLPQTPNESAKFGRFLIHPDYRQMGLGYTLVNKVMQFIRQQSSFQVLEVVISAQAHLQNFYSQAAGFKTYGDTYLEDDIPHIAMSTTIQT